jgi:putative acetyltransferase
VNADRVCLVRAARVDDIEGMIAVFRASVHGIARRDYTADQVCAWAPEAIDRAAWLRRAERHLVWVAAGATGTLGGFIELADDGCVDMLYVHPALARQGVATALLATAEASAQARGLTDLFTAASLTARPFFERHGFQVIAPQTVHRHALALRNFRMAKTVATRHPTAYPLHADGRANGGL